MPVNVKFTCNAPYCSPKVWKPATAFGAESDAENTCAEISGNELLFPSKVAEDVRTGRHDLRDGAETSLTALGVWFAPPARWADAVKGAALGIGAFVAWRRLYGSSGGS